MSVREIDRVGIENNNPALLIISVFQVFWYKLQYNLYIRMFPNIHKFSPFCANDVYIHTRTELLAYIPMGARARVFPCVCVHARFRESFDSQIMTDYRKITINQTPSNGSHSYDTKNRMQICVRLRR